MSTRRLERDKMMRGDWSLAPGKPVHYNRSCNGALGIDRW